MSSISPYDVVRGPAPKPPRHSLLKRSLDLDEAGGDNSLIPPPPIQSPNTVSAIDGPPDVWEDPFAPVDIDESTSNQRWQGGFSFLPESCGDGIIWVPCGTENESAISDTRIIQTYEPTAIEVAVQCSSFGYKAIDFRDRATRFLNGVQHRVAGAEFWYGTKAIAEGLPNNYLEKSGYTDLGVATGPTVMLASLQSYLDQTGIGGWGFIHAPKRLVDAWMTGWLIDDDDTDPENIRLFDAYGNEIIADPGYPDVVNEDGNWEAYATGPVYGKLGGMMIVPNKMSAALDRATNTIVYRAERMHALVWDGCQHAKSQIPEADLVA